ncbi:ABC transporter transmembrane domain type 1 [Penicillium hordei]|uniref:ABC transporter transmembrane domain type 1 n=1 Tax=Penicillium hordei TaxID=40994 RepID=A0AAD6DSW0_9EURO|nr:ABC transporter transmembrane domain type 1 [Penicillium hordei]KAJ5592431.1 ABC transporter transmembrane domain type 1 [Penicillium hordei]
MNDRTAWALRRHPERRLEFPWQMCRAFKGPLALMALPRIFLIGFTFSQPFLIASVLNWLDNSHSASNLGYGLIGAKLLIYLGMALSNLIYDQMLYRLVTMFRGTASSMIYDHALHIPDGTLGDRSATVTLMTTDVDRIIASLITLNEFWARTIEVGIGIALLALQLGGGSIYISKHIGGHQKVWVDAVQQRISITRSLLDGIQTIKATGLSQTFVRLVQRKRAEETHQMATYRWSVVWKNMIQNLPWALAPALTFVVYAAQGKELNATKAFSSLSIITLLTNPASKLLSAIPSIAASSGSFDRVQTFILLETSPQHTTEGLYRTRETEVDASPHIAEMQYMSFKGPPDTTNLQTPVISMKNLSIRPSSSAKIVLRDVNLEVPLGALAIIQGPVVFRKIEAASGYTWPNSLRDKVNDSEHSTTGFLRSNTVGPKCPEQSEDVATNTASDIHKLARILTDQLQQHHGCCHQCHTQQESEHQMHHTEHLSLGKYIDRIQADGRYPDVLSAATMARREDNLAGQTSTDRKREIYTGINSATPDAGPLHLGLVSDHEPERPTTVTFDIDSIVGLLHSLAVAKLGVR